MLFSRHVLGLTGLQPYQMSTHASSQLRCQCAANALHCELRCSSCRLHMSACCCRAFLPSLCGSLLAVLSVVDVRSISFVLLCRLCPSSSVAVNATDGDIDGNTLQAALLLFTAHWCDSTVSLPLWQPDIPWYEPYHPHAVWVASSVKTHASKSACTPWMAHMAQPRSSSH